MYCLDPFNYLIGSMLVFRVWGTEVTCAQYELAVFDPPAGATCVSYLETYLEGSGSGARLLNPEATAACQVCPYRDGSEYLKTLNLLEYSYGWRDAGIVAIFVVISYALVYG